MDIQVAIQSFVLSLVMTLAAAVAHFTRNRILRGEGESLKGIFRVSAAITWFCFASLLAVWALYAYDNL